MSKSKEVKRVVSNAAEIFVSKAMENIGKNSLFALTIQDTMGSLEVFRKKLKEKTVEKLLCCGHHTTTVSRFDTNDVILFLEIEMTDKGIIMIQFLKVKGTIEEREVIFEELFQK